MCCLAIALGAAATYLTAASSVTAAGTVGWAIHAVAEPSEFSTSDALRCESELKCDRYQLLVTNVGNVPSTEPVVVTDKLPSGITTVEAPESGKHVGRMVGEGREAEWGKCTEGASVTCTLSESVPAGASAPFLDIVVSGPAAMTAGTLKNEITVTGGGATAATTESLDTPAGTLRPSFDISEFELGVGLPGGRPALGAATHPWEATGSFGIPSIFSPPGAFQHAFQSVENVSKIATELPAGLVGDPEAAGKCTETELRAGDCPADSEVGSLAVMGSEFVKGEFEFTGGLPDDEVSAVYNMVPEGGYPAEFGFVFAQQEIFLYANVLHTSEGYRVTVSTPGVPASLETTDAVITFFGDPGKLNGSGSEVAFLTNPADCSTTPLEPSRIELESWEDPGHPMSRESTVYPSLVGCGALKFQPSIDFSPSGSGETPPAEPGTTEVDSPSAYTFALTLPQTSGFNESATPELRNATVALPPGVSVSPAAAQGLVSCEATGSEGINIGSADVGSYGQDIGDPEATELGAGHAGGNGSPYDDGFYHTAPGKCPTASTLGSVRVESPLLEKPLYGHLYLAQPKCGGAGQPECTQADAEDGELFGLYLEVGGPNGEDVSWEGESRRKEEAGVIVKLEGTVSANPSTGQLTATFAENPQLPFSKLEVHIDGGPKAPLANPQGCGSYQASSDLVPWSAPSTADATPTGEPFAITGCSASMPFAPSFEAGMTSTVAGSYGQFTLTLARRDGEQDFAAVSTTLPPGLVGMISNVPLCGEEQANAGSCPEASQIGTTTVTAGAGSQPFPVTGRVYLTGPYDGAPFGLSIVVAAKAGPFNLGDVVVRAAIDIDPNTAAVTVTSGLIPQIRDGVPFRVKTINVTVNRAGFMRNPTNCESKAIEGTIAAAQGASATVSSHFAASGCAALAFKPSFSSSTQAKTSKEDGASLDVRIAYPIPGEANIKSVKTELPLQLPSRLTTLQKACPVGTFAANPAACPPDSIVGIARATTPVLPVPVEGPAYLVSHANESFPNLVLVLQGDGVRVDLTGLTDIKKGITSSTFASVPDVPVSAFELYLPEGRYSILAANGNLCAVTQTKTVRKRVELRRHGRVVRRHGRIVTVVKNVKETVPGTLAMPTTITGQNGVVIKQDTPITVTGCPKVASKPLRNPSQKPSQKPNSHARTTGRARRGAVSAATRGGRPT
jgi:hypothetical protein